MPKNKLQARLQRQYTKRHMEIMKKEKATSAKLQVVSFVNGYILGKGKDFEKLSKDEYQKWYEEAMSKAHDLHTSNVKELKDE